MRLVDWLARLVVMVISALATLALVGSLASVSNTPLGRAFPGEVSDRHAEAPDSSDAPTPFGQSVPEAANTTSAEGTPSAARVAASARQDAREDLARWLKALTYAVLALAGFAAAGLVALVRIAQHLGRLAAR